MGSEKNLYQCHMATFDPIQSKVRSVTLVLTKDLGKQIRYCDKSQLNSKLSGVIETSCSTAWQLWHTLHCTCTDRDVGCSLQLIIRESKVCSTSYANNLTQIECE